MLRESGLTFKSVVFLVIGSVMGAGIFFKTQTVLAYSNQNVLWSIFVWLISAVAIICMGLALVEIAGSSKNNLSILGWSRKYSPPFISSMCKYFVLFLMPLTYFFMPLYVIMSFQDGLSAWGLTNSFDSSYNWFYIVLIGCGISGWSILTGVSAKIGNIQNWIYSIINFVPIIAAVIVGIIILATKGVQNPLLPDTRWTAVYKEDGTADFTLYTLSPLTGIFGSITAIYFAFDGFYFAAGVRSEMRQPHKLSRAIVIGLIIITLVYITIAFIMSLATKGGKFSDYNDYFISRNYRWLAGILNMTIGIGVMSIINGYSLWAPRFVEDLIALDEIWVPTRYKNMINHTRPWVGTIYVAIITFPVVIMLSLIGALGYIPSNDYVSYDAPGSLAVARLYNFADLLSNWISLFTIAWIVLAIIGYMQKTKQEERMQGRHSRFLLYARISTIITIPVLIMTLLQPFIDLFIAGIGKSWEQIWVDDNIIGNICLIVTLFIFFMCMTMPIFIQNIRAARRKYDVIR